MEGSTTNDALLNSKDVLGAPVAAFVVYDEPDSVIPERENFSLEMNLAGGRNDILNNAGQHIPLYSNPNQVALLPSLQHGDLNANNMAYHKMNSTAHQLQIISNSPISYNNCANLPGVLNHTAVPESVQILTAGPHRDCDGGLDFQYPSYLPTVTLNRGARRADLASQYRVYGDVPQASQPVSRTFYVSNHDPTSTLLTQPNPTSVINSRMEASLPKNLLVQPKIEMSDALPCLVEPITDRLDNEVLSNARVCRQNSIQLESSALAKERADLEELRKQLILKEQALNEKEERLNMVQGKDKEFSNNLFWSGVPNKHRYTTLEAQHCEPFFGSRHISVLDKQSTSNTLAAASNANSGVADQGTECMSHSLEDMNENLEVNPRLISKTYKRKLRSIDKSTNETSGSSVKTNVHGHQKKKLMFPETLSNGASSITITPISGNLETSGTSAHQFKALPNDQVKVEKLLSNTCIDDLDCPSEASHIHTHAYQSLLPKKRKRESSPSVRVQDKLSHECEGAKRSRQLQEDGACNVNHSCINTVNESSAPCGISADMKDSSETTQRWEKLSPVASFIIASPEHSSFDSREDINPVSGIPNSLQYRDSSSNSDAPGHPPSAVDHSTLRPTVLTLPEQCDGRNYLPEHHEVACMSSIPAHEEVRYIKTLPQQDIRFVKTLAGDAQHDVQYIETAPEHNHVKYIKTFPDRNDVQYILPSNLNSVSRSFGNSVTFVHGAPVESRPSLLNGSYPPSFGGSLPAEQSSLGSSPRAVESDGHRRDSQVSFQTHVLSLNSANSPGVNTEASTLENDALHAVGTFNDSNDESLTICDGECTPQEPDEEQPCSVGCLEDSSKSKMKGLTMTSLAANQSPSKNCCNNEPSNPHATVSLPIDQNSLSDSRSSEDPANCPSSQKISTPAKDGSPPAVSCNVAEISKATALASLSPNTATKGSPMHARVVSPLSFPNSPGSPDVSYFPESEVLSSDIYSNKDEEHSNARTSSLFPFVEPTPEEQCMTVMSSSDNATCSDSNNAVQTNQCLSASVTDQADEIIPADADDPANNFNSPSSDINSSIEAKFHPNANKEQSHLSNNINEYSRLLESTVCDNSFSRGAGDCNNDDTILSPNKSDMVDPIQNGASDCEASGADPDDNSVIGENVTVSSQPSKRRSQKTSSRKRKPSKARKVMMQKIRNFYNKKSAAKEEVDADSPANYQCGVCCDSVVYTSCKNFKRHVMSAHNGLARATGLSQDFTEADEKFAYKQVLAAGLKLVCKRCKASFASLLGYEGHMTWCGKSALERTHLCPKCGWSGTIFTVRIHLRTCSGFKKCDPADEPEVRPAKNSKVKCQVIHEQLANENSDGQDSDSPTIENYHKADFSKNNDYFLVLCKRVKKPLPEKLLSQWQTDASKNLPLVCCFESCGETLKTVEKISEHVNGCPLRPLKEFLFMCTLCDLTEEGLSMEEIVAHLLKKHSEELKQVSVIQRRGRTRKCISRKCDDKHRILSSTLDFREINHSNQLFQDWQVRMNEWTIPAKPFQYFSKCAISPKFCIDDSKSNSDWRSLDLFGAMSHENSSYLFCGGCITASAWCTFPCDSNFGQSCDQVLALGVTSEARDIVIASPQHFRGTIQIWNFDVLTRINSDDATSPTLSFHIAHNYGCVTSLQWCPSGAFEPVGSGNRLGVLAAACTNGEIHLWFIPHPQLLPRAKCRVYHKSPDLTLSQASFGDDDEIESVPLRIDWLPSKGHMLIAASMSDGSVFVWNLHASSLNSSNASNGRILYPCWNLNTHLGPSRAIAWCPVSNGANLATGGDDHMHHLWDLQGFCEPARLSTSRRDVFTDTKWPLNTTATLLSFEDSVSDGCTAAFRECGFFGNVLSYCKSRSPTWSLSFSDLLGATLQGTQIGECVITFPKDLYKVAHEKIDRQHRLCYSTSVRQCRLSTKNGKEELGVVFQETPEILEPKSSKPVDPLSLKSGSTPVEDKEVSCEWSSKGSSLVSITSVAFNPNIGTHDWLFCGYKSGLARVLRILPQTS